jgi:ABC-type transporter Mla MlaB component
MLEVRREAGTRASLHGPLTAGSAKELKAGLLALVGVPEVVDLDLSGVTEVDFAGVQVVVAFARSRGSRGVRAAGCPERVLARLRMAGLAGWFGG